jgi:hypothetical protein
MTIAGAFNPFAPDDNYGFLEQPVGEPMERSGLTIVR